MKTGRLMVALATILFALSISSVFANGYSVLTPIIGTSTAAAIGAPPLNGAMPPVTGTVTLHYSDGAPVVLAYNIVPFELCTTSVCVTVQTTLKQVSPGTYEYSFQQPPSLTGAITVTIPAYSLVENTIGKQFPSVDTVIGSLFISSSANGNSQDTRLTSFNPVSQSQSNYEYNQAVPVAQPFHQSPVFQAVLASIVLILGVGGLIVLPSRKKFSL
ncbi:MAG: hypothetical protein ACLPY5_10040 [Candidatus Bathyarchaeia archaeon]